MYRPLLPIEGRRHIHYRNSTLSITTRCMEQRPQNAVKPNLGRALHRLSPVLQYNQHCERWNLGLSKAPEETTLQLR